MHDLGLAPNYSGQLFDTLLVKWLVSRQMGCGISEKSTKFNPQPEPLEPNSPLSLAVTNNETLHRKSVRNTTMSNLLKALAATSGVVPLGAAKFRSS